MGQLNCIDLSRARSPRARRTAVPQAPLVLAVEVLVLGVIAFGFWY